MAVTRVTATPADSLYAHSEMNHFVTTNTTHTTWQTQILTKPYRNTKITLLHHTRRFPSSFLGPCNFSLSSSVLKCCTPKTPPLRARTCTCTRTHKPIIYNYLPIRWYITTAVEENTLNELKIKYSLLVAEHGHSTPPIKWRSPFYPPPIRKTYPLTYMYTLFCHLLLGLESACFPRRRTWIPYAFYVSLSWPTGIPSTALTAPGDLHKTLSSSLRKIIHGNVNLSNLFMRTGQLTHLPEKLQCFKTGEKVQS